ncbi:MAG: hypothetical protein DI590_21285 [Methylorubrum populi]|nr:MAG: hypothetical protein DI590_21285 [Methylorubrum populi]
MAERAGADIAALCGDLRIAFLERFADLAPRKQQALLHRLDRIGKDVERRPIGINRRGFRGRRRCDSMRGLSLLLAPRDPQTPIAEPAALAGRVAQA